MTISTNADDRSPYPLGDLGELTEAIGSGDLKQGVSVPSRGLGGF